MTACLWDLTVDRWLHFFDNFLSRRLSPLADDGVEPSPNSSENSLVYLYTAAN